MVAPRTGAGCGAGCGAGWALLGPDPRIAAWASAAHLAALATIASSAEEWRCGGTWFVGVDALSNGPDGAINGTLFPWPCLPLPPEPLHRGQLSVIRPGYPQPSPAETPAAFAYRQRRDAAHLDGLLAIGPTAARMVKEPHGWILGLPLNEATAAPLVVWDGSHHLMRQALHAALAPHPPATWGSIDITSAYKTARRQVFDTCRRVELPARPGEATLIHRLTLHGVAPAQPNADIPPEGRMVAYFRPQLATVAEWLTLP